MDESESLDDLFNDEPGDKGAAVEPGKSDTADAPADAGSEEEAEAEAEEAAEAEAVAAMSDDSAPADDAAAEPASAPADADEVVDFSDLTPDNTDIAEPAEDMAAEDAAKEAAAEDTAAEDAPKEDAAEDMAAEDATADSETADDDATPEPPAAASEIEDDAPPEPKSSSKVDRDADTSSAGAAEDLPNAADGMRLWTDNTGKHQVRARLVTVLDGKVRLKKETGRFTTVPLERLSVADLAFVRRQAPAVASAGKEQTASNQTGLAQHTAVER